MRADQYLYANLFTESRQKAQTLIKSGAVVIDGVRVNKASLEIDESVQHDVVITDAEKIVFKVRLDVCERRREALPIACFRAEPPRSMPSIREEISFIQSSKAT